MKVKYIYDTTDDDILSTFMQTIVKTMDTDLTITVSDIDEYEEEDYDIELKLIKEWDDNEAEIMHIIEFLRLLQEQKYTPKFIINFDELFSGTWDFDDLYTENYMLDATPYDEEDESDSPLSEIKDECKKDEDDRYPPAKIDE